MFPCSSEITYFFSPPRNIRNPRGHAQTLCPLQLPGSTIRQNQQEHQFPSLDLLLLRYLTKDPKVGCTCIAQYIGPIQQIQIPMGNSSGQGLGHHLLEQFVYLVYICQPPSGRPGKERGGDAHIRFYRTVV